MNIFIKNDCKTSFYMLYTNTGQSLKLKVMQKTGPMIGNEQG